MIHARYSLRRARLWAIPKSSRSTPGLAGGKRRTGNVERSAATPLTKLAEVARYSPMTRAARILGHVYNNARIFSSSTVGARRSRGRGSSMSKERGATAACGHRPGFPYNHPAGWVSAMVPCRAWDARQQSPTAPARSGALSSFRFQQFASARSASVRRSAAASPRQVRCGIGPSFAPHPSRFPARQGASSLEATISGRDDPRGPGRGVTARRGMVGGAGSRASR